MVEKTILESGLTVISEYRPELPSLAMSFTLLRGSRHESPVISGIHHLIEHMLFKGSEKYDLRAIASLSDRLGGSLNAFTGKELTQYYLKSLDETFPQAFDLLGDLVTAATFPREEFRKEINVVLQEIRESRDNPDTHAFELFFSRLFPDQALGCPISGEPERLSRLDRDDVFGFYSETYRPPNLLLAAAGHVNHHDLVREAENRFGGFAPATPADFTTGEPEFAFQTTVHRKPSLEQVYAVIGFAGIPKASPLRYRFMLMNEILGAGMSSRLFQKIREDQGLAYTVSSFGDSYHDCGVQMVYAVIEPKNINPYLRAVKHEIEILKREGVGPEELARAKDHLKSSIVLQMESNLSRMRFHVNQELYHRREIKLSEILEEINRASREDIHQVLTTHLDLERTAVLLYGNVPDDTVENLNLAAPADAW